jgi:hypothetical protein
MPTINVVITKKSTFKGEVLIKDPMHTIKIENIDMPVIKPLINPINNRKNIDKCLL